MLSKGSKILLHSLGCIYKDEQCFYQKQDKLHKKMFERKYIKMLTNNGCLSIAFPSALHFSVYLNFSMTKI